MLIFPLVIGLALLSSIPFLFVASKVKHPPAQEKVTVEDSELELEREEAFKECYGYPIE